MERCGNIDKQRALRTRRHPAVSDQAPRRTAPGPT
jgi:hypothetical protein